MAQNPPEAGTSALPRVTLTQEAYMDSLVRTYRAARGKDESKVAQMAEEAVRQLAVAEAATAQANVFAAFSAAALK